MKTTLKKNLLALGVLASLWSTGAVANTFEEFLAVAVPVESRLQGCYGQLDYYELTAEERIRLDHASAYLNEIPIRFAAAHTADAYEAVEMEFMVRLVESNKTRQQSACDSAYVDKMEQQAHEIWDRYNKVKGPLQR